MAVTVIECRYTENKQQLADNRICRQALLSLRNFLSCFDVYIFIYENNQDAAWQEYEFAKQLKRSHH